MCYFLYGAVNDGINKDDYNKLMSSDTFHFNIGTSEQVNKCVKLCGEKFRITDRICDCETAIGNHKTGESEIAELSELIKSFKNIRGTKYIALSKNWWKDTNASTETVNIYDIDLISFLAELKENCLYKIEFYK